MEDRLAYIIVFAVRYRRRPGKGGKSIRADAVSKALTAIGKGIADLGGEDPRFPFAGARHYRPVLADYMSAIRKEDDPSSRAYPVNMTIIRHLVTSLDLEHERYGILNRHVIDLIIVAFFWLLRPAEYLQGSGDPSDTRSQAFRFRDISLRLGGAVSIAPSAPLNDENDLKQLQNSWLTFSDQKNAVRGETVGHATTSDAFFCGAKALGRIALHFRKYKAPPDTPISHHYNPTDKKWHAIRPALITNALRHAARACQHITGIDPDLVSARSLRPGGATALMMAGVDSDHICLMGRWRSDAMFRYLRIQVAAHQKSFAQRMLDNGNYTFAPAAYQQGNALPLDTPAPYRAVLQHSELYDSDSE